MWIKLLIRDKFPTHLAFSNLRPQSEDSLQRVCAVHVTSLFAIVRHWASECISLRYTATIVHTTNGHQFRNHRTKPHQTALHSSVEGTFCVCVSCLPRSFVRFVYVSMILCTMYDVYVCVCVFLFATHLRVASCRRTSLWSFVRMT